MPLDIYHKSLQLHQRLRVPWMLYRGNDLTCARDPNYPKKRERGVRFLLTAQSIDIRALISMPKVQVLESGGGRGYNVS